MGPPSTHYLNADFDLGLRARRIAAPSAAILRQLDELSLQALLGCAAGDAALLPIEVPDAYLEHLAGCGLHVPRVLRHPTSDTATRLRPFGWSAEAIELNARHDTPAPHPPLELVRRVNGRAFALGLERELCPDQPHGTIVRSTAELESAALTDPPHGGWMLKAEHGNAGLGNRRVRGATLLPADYRFAERQLRADRELLIEPWLPRVRDWSTVFDVPFDAATCRVYETFCTADGAVVGALFEPCPDGPWTAELSSIAGRLASRLSAVGYLGPVCLDSFEWCDGERSRLRSIVDLNCRHAVSDGAWRTWRALFPDRTLLYRFASRRHVTMPETLQGSLESLGELRYGRDARRGILIASPRSVSARLVLLIVGRDRDDVEGLERAFNERFSAERR